MKLLQMESTTKVARKELQTQLRVASFLILSKIKHMQHLTLHFANNVPVVLCKVRDMYSIVQPGRRPKGLTDEYSPVWPKA